MTKRERVVSAIKLQKPEGVPSCFSLHFPEECARGDAAVKAHIEYFKKTDADIFKIMNEHFVPTIGKIDSVKDMTRACSREDADGFINAQLEQIKKILDLCGDDGFTINTVHGITASTLHPVEHFGVPYEEARDIQSKFLRDDRTIMVDFMKRVRDAMCELSVRSIELGVDGIYYASLGGEPRWFTDEEFAECIAPLEIEILDEIKKTGGYSLLHICKDGLNMNRYAPYAGHADIVNWGVYEVPYSLEDGKKFFPNTCILGGLQSRGGILEKGTEAEITSEVKRLCEAFPGGGYILGADCTVATEQDLNRLRVAVEAARSM